MAITEEHLLQLIEKYDVITFDVYDTLIQRNVLKPSDVFLYEYGKTGKILRILAEMLARKESASGEVTLDDIYRFLPYDRKREVEFEKRIYQANPFYLRIYNRIKDKKKIYAISDMYLDSAVIKDILHRAGFDIDIVYVSCEYSCSKKNGALFRKFLKKEGLSSKKVLHIGDNRQSDSWGAAKAGIKGICIPKDRNLLAYRKSNRDNYELNAFINHGLNRISNPAERIGYEVVGPIIYEFCRWIHDRYEHYGFERLFFLARDMHFTYQVYRKLFPKDKADYLYISRKSLDFAKGNSDEFCKYLKAEGCYGNVAIVDTGWCGSAQVQIEKYAKKICSKTDVGGLYLGTKAAYRIYKRSRRSNSCFYSKLYEQFKCTLFPPFLETLIGSSEEQVKGYEEGKPVFAERSTPEMTNEIKRGAEKFVMEYAPTGKRIAKKEAVIAFERMFDNPRKKDIRLLRKLIYEDDVNSSIVTRPNNGKMLEALSHSAWKGAFFKETSFCVRAVFSIYKFLNSVRIILFDIREFKKNGDKNEL